MTDETRPENPANEDSPTPQAENAPDQGAGVATEEGKPSGPAKLHQNVEIRDVSVTKDDATHAHVELTATYIDPAGDGRAIDATEFTLQVVKPERDWLIARVAPVRVLER